MDGFTIDADLVRSLVREQHPDLAGLDLREVAGGWDNHMWRLGDELAVRMPRTARAASLLRNELRWMPVLAPRLPLPVPTTVRIGAPSARFPQPWTITAWVPGEPADRAEVTRGRHAAHRLAAFLRALHRPAPAAAPASPNRGIPLRTLTAQFDRRFEALNGIAGLDGGEVRDIWQEAVSAPDWPGPRMWLHGDLHPANVVTADGTLAGVLDFGDLCAGDPATDLAAAWLLLPSGADRDFLDAYGCAGRDGHENTDGVGEADVDVDGEADEAMVRRARGWAILLGLSLIGVGRAGVLGLPGGKVTWGPAGRSALARVLESRQGRARPLPASAPPA
ncbi:aminoglycoside phosphotransferase family protein [Kitasatospora sp. NBC_00240]|uniref:aminoglycoside phosphotransferase family protein n=1 Tax=Kitasatospora sp. NBC_00240 TaxID=2903567 RepID=UPI002254CDF2|nr:aminoglycoside phosphotransferase family protein [Kitasatospora sp. NBC_00240]MCX5214616.1 aminoglycoside phosphotransferase family protein [Kitasatospora sp. NBC_00240]